MSELEFDSSGQLIRLSYLEGDPEIAAHARNYSGVPYVVRRLRGQAGPFGWEEARTFSPEGSLEGSTMLLLDDARREWMVIEHDPDGQVAGITKYDWDADDELRYAFEFTPDGRFADAQDLLANSSVMPHEVSAQLSDPDFFADGFALPRALRGTPIPSLEEQQ